MLWRKSRMAWMKAYREWLDRADWFIRGDDDTFMVWEGEGGRGGGFGDWFIHHFASR